MNNIKNRSIDSIRIYTAWMARLVEAVAMAIKCKNLKLTGVHCHIGSQIFEMDSFKDATDLMMDFIGQTKGKLNYECVEIDLGGGFGIHYIDGDQPA